MANSIEVRESKFELLRLVCIFMIVFYHLLDYYIYPETHSLIYKTLWIPLHVAVVCFVLISGYYHIRFKIKGIAKILFPLFIFYFPGEIIRVLYGDITIKEFVMDILFPPYWYVRVYLYLYLFSPVLNKYIDNVSLRNRLYTLLAVFFISVLMPILGEESLRNGKNLVFFIFLYFLGDILHVYSDKVNKISLGKMVFSYILVNVILMVIYHNFFGSVVSKLIWRFSYPYNSPFLIMNATFLFLLFGRIKFESVTINVMATSVLSIYVLHQEYFLYNGLIVPCMHEVLLLFNNPIYVIICLIILTFFIIIIGVCINRIVLPINRIYLSFVERFQRKIRFVLL